LRFYQQKIKLFIDFCETNLVKNIHQITPSLIREFLLYLEETNHNPGGRHAVFRTLRAFLYWFEDEVEPEGWKNPIRKVKPPRVPQELIEPVSYEAIEKLLKTCNRGTFVGDRDYAIILCLLDTGARAREFLDIDLDDINQASGEILIRKGKGKKPRFVYISKKSKRALRKYLHQRKDDLPALWVTHPRFGSQRLSYDGLRAVLTRRSKLTGIEEPSIHDFRRAFCLSMLRSGTDIFTLSKFMGHSSLAVMQRYLNQTSDDTKQAHRRASPVEKIILNC
jgi:integrase/recombinase XerD